jgi:hypothetical protein
MNFRNIISFKYVIPIAVVIWTLMLLIITSTPGNVSVEIFIMFFSTAMTVIIGIDGVRRSNGNNLRIIAALFNIIIGLILLLFAFDLMRISLILLIGGELFGISTAIRIRNQSFDSNFPVSTRRPAPVPSPEPEPEPRPI